MASTRPAPPLDSLELLVNDVIVQAGKAFKSSRRDAPRPPSLASVQRIRDSHVAFNSALDDVESDLIRAKAVLQRDLDQLRAKRRPVVIPEPVMIPLAPAGPGPEPAEPEPPSALPPLIGPNPGLRGVSKQPATPTTQVPRSTPKPKQGAAPFPNMGIDPGLPGPSPQLTASKVKMESRAAPPKPPLATQAPQPGDKGGSPAVKAASSSPALKSVQPAGKTGSPANKSTVAPGMKPGSPPQRPPPPSPANAAKTVSPVATPARPVPKASPPTGPKAPLTSASAKPVAAVPAVTAPSVTPAAQVPVPVPLATTAPPASAAVPVSMPNPALATRSLGQADPLDDMLDLGDGAVEGGVGGPTPATAQNSQLNFTDMQFSLAPANLETQSRGQSRVQGSAGAGAMETEFDLETFVADATNNILSDSFSGSAGNQSSGPLADAESSRPLDLGSGADGSVSLSGPEAEVVDSNIDDLFRLSGDTDFRAAGETNFDNLWIEGDTSMEDLDDKYFDLT